MKHDILIEQDDVLFSITPKVADLYTRARARQTFHVVLQCIKMTKKVAEIALELAIGNRVVTPTLCAMSTYQLLRKLPSCEALSTTYFPKELRSQFGELLGVKENAPYEYDDPD